MSEEDKPVSVSDKVEILSTDDEKIKAIGEILSRQKPKNSHFFVQQLIDCK